MRIWPIFAFVKYVVFSSAFYSFAMFSSLKVFKILLTELNDTMYVDAPYVTDLVEAKKLSRDFDS